MESLSPLAITVTVASVFAGAVALSAAGFGKGMVALPFMLLVLDPVTAVVVINSSQIPLYLVVLRDTRGEIRFRDVRVLALFGAGGAALGAFALVAAAPDVLRIGVLSLIVALAIVMALDPFSRFRPPAVLGPPIGFGVAVMLGTLGIGGPLMALYALARGWKKDSVRGTLAAYFLPVMLVLATGYAVARLYSPAMGIMVGASVLPSIAGAMVGTRLAHSMSERVFHRAAIALVVCSSAAVLIREFVG